MSNHRDRRPPLSQGTASVSLVAVVACALASDALASQPPAEPSVGERALSARVGAISERIRSGEPTLVRELPAEAKIAQWRN
jgi:hypothetical protein